MGLDRQSLHRLSRGRGPSPVQDRRSRSTQCLFGPVVSLGELAILAVAVAALLVFIGSYFAVPVEDGRVLGHFEVEQLRRARWGAAILGVALSALAFSVIQGWLSALAPDWRERVVGELAGLPGLARRSPRPPPAAGPVRPLRGALQARGTGPRTGPGPCMHRLGLRNTHGDLCDGRSQPDALPYGTGAFGRRYPFAMAPLFSQVPERRATSDDSVDRVPRGAWLTITVALLVLGANTAVNHTRIDSEVPIPSVLKARREPHRRRTEAADAYAFGLGCASCRTRAT